MGTTKKHTMELSLSTKGMGGTGKMLFACHISLLTPLSRTPDCCFVNLLASTPAVTAAAPTTLGFAVAASTPTVATTLRLAVPAARTSLLPVTTATAGALATARAFAVGRALPLTAAAPLALLLLVFLGRRFFRLGL